MIFIVVKFPVRPDSVDQFPEAVRGYTDATRAEPGNIFFEWNRSLDEPGVFTLVEAFEDDAAEAHVTAPHFKEGLDAIRPMLLATPRIVSHHVEGVDGWGPMGELVID